MNTCILHCLGNCKPEKNDVDMFPESEYPTEMLTNYVQIKEEDKDQESIQSSTTPDPGHHMGK